MQILKWLAALTIGVTLAFSGNIAEAVKKKPVAAKKTTKKKTQIPTNGLWILELDFFGIS